MKVTKTSQFGIDLILSFEGFEPRPYLCSANVPTIGFGTTRYPNGRKVSLSDTEITRAKAIEYFKYDLEHFEQRVDAFCRDDISQSNFDALVSFCYNCGENNLKSSNLLKKVNINPKDPSIRDEFLKWTRANGKIVYGLKRRRVAESAMYFNEN
jgi:lysozyme